MGRFSRLLNGPTKEELQDRRIRHTKALFRDVFKVAAFSVVFCVSILLLVTLPGCSQPNDKKYKVTLTSPYGDVVKTYYFLDSGKPRVMANSSGMYVRFTNGSYFDAPIGWLIEVDFVCRIDGVK